MEIAEIVMNPVRQNILPGNMWIRKKDMLLFTNCTLMLTDEEFSGFLSEINEVERKIISKLI